MRLNFVIASSNSREFWLELSNTHSIIVDGLAVCPVFILTFFQSSGARPRWLRRQSEAVRQQNCDVANRCNRADRSWHRHRVSSGPRENGVRLLAQGRERGEGGRGSDRNSSTFGQC